MKLNLEDKKTPAQLLMAYEQIFPGIHPEWIDGVIGIKALPGWLHGNVTSQILRTVGGGPPPPGFEWRRGMVDCIGNICSVFEQRSHPPFGFGGLEKRSTLSAAGWIPCDHSSRLGV